MTVACHGSAGLRRLAASIAMRVLSMLVVVALPLQGVSNRVSSIVSPAHYHLPAQMPAPAVEAPHDRSASEDRDEPHDLDNPGSRQDRVAEDDEHRHHLTEDSDHRPLPEAGHDDDHDLHPHRPHDAGHHDSLIGHHSHEVEQADVVYLEGEPDHSDAGAAGKQATAGAEAALPSSSMAIPAMAGTQALPEGVRLFVSRTTEPLLRPPSARGSSQA